MILINNGVWFSVRHSLERGTEMDVLLGLKSASPLPVY